MRWVMGLLVLTGSLAQVPGPMSVEVRTFQYGPASLQVTVGTEVVWSNRDAIAHTVTSGTPDGLIVGAALAAAPAAAQTSASDLRTGLNTMLAEHVYLADAALGGRSTEFKDAAAALDANSVALGKAIGSVYGDGAGAAFLELWRKHIGFFVDYTTGVAKKDKAAQDKAVNDLIGYAADFAAFLASANPNLPKDVVHGLVKDHVVGLKAVVDAQARGDWSGAYARLREAAGHMQMIADPLAGAISKQFLEKFAMR